MSSTWQLNEKSTGVVTTTVNGEVWKEAQDKATNKLVKKVKLDGFREGQVPKAMAMKHVKKEAVLMEAVDMVAADALSEAIKEHDLLLIDRPQLDIEKIEEEEVTLKFIVTIRPEVTLGQYKDLGITKEEVSVSDDEVNGQVKALQEKFAELEIKENGSVENGDTAVIDFEGFKDGVAFEGGKGDNYPLEIGSNSFVPGFEEQLIGMKNEETKDINITFPQEYTPELAGAEVVFKVTVHEIKTKQLAEANDELIKTAEIKDVETLEQFKEKTKEDILLQKEQQASADFHNNVLKTVSDNATVEVPEVMIEQEINNIINEYDQNLRQQGFSLEQFLQMSGQDIEAIKEQQKENAEARAKLNLVLAQIAKEENIKVDDEAIENEYNEIAKMYSMEIEKVKEVISKDAIAYDLTTRKTIDLIEGK